MKAPKNIIYPVRLGKKGTNLLYSQRGDIRFGRWFDINQDTDEKAKWIRVAATGSLVDRSVGGTPYSEKMTDYAIMTYFADPIANMPRFDMVPIDSKIFDTEDVTANDEDDIYNFQTHPATATPAIPSATIMTMATAIMSVIILAGSVSAQEN